MARVKVTPTMEDDEALAASICEVVKNNYEVAARWWRCRAVRQLAHGDDLECWYSLMRAEALCDSVSDGYIRAGVYPS